LECTLIYRIATYGTHTLDMNCSCPADSRHSRTSELRNITHLRHIPWLQCLLAISIVTLSGYGLLRSCSAVCGETIIAIAMSPDGRYEAQEEERLCENGAFGTILNHTVLLRATGDQERTAVVSVEFSGHEQHRPNMSWDNSTLLRIALPNIPYTKIHTHDTHDTHIEFDYPNGMPKEP